MMMRLPPVAARSLKNSLAVPGTLTAWANESQPPVGVETESRTIS
jgi:hypothetical protein